MKDLLLSLEEKFLKKYRGSTSDTLWFFAPGRVNLIGEHIDYCGGMVLPATIQMGTYAVVRQNHSDLIRMGSLLKPNSVVFPTQNMQYEKTDDWGNYPKGIFAEYAQRGVKIPGVDILFDGDIPGGGLSSSASLEVCTALLIEAITHFNSDPDPIKNRKQMALLCQHSENSFIGVNCGIMDQAAIALGDHGQATYLNCDTLEFSPVATDFGDYRLQIINSGKGHSLTDSAYNKRRQEYEEALHTVQKHLSVQSLCEIPGKQLEEALKLLDNPVLKKRARHVITENDRVKKALAALKTGKLKEFGDLLQGSHRSLQVDYEVTGKELDALFECCLEAQGVLGARMTGGGFGGCAIALVHNHHVENFQKTVAENYSKRIGLKPEFYSAQIGYKANQIVKAG